MIISIFLNDEKGQAAISLLGLSKDSNRLIQGLAKELRRLNLMPAGAVYTKKVPRTKQTGLLLPLLPPDQISVPFWPVEELSK